MRIRNSVSIPSENPLDTNALSLPPSLRTCAIGRKSMAKCSSLGARAAGAMSFVQPLRKRTAVGLVKIWIRQRAAMSQLLSDQLGKELLVVGDHLLRVERCSDAVHARLATDSSYSGKLRHQLVYRVTYNSGLSIT